MELQDNRPTSAHFTAARDVTIVSEAGDMCSVFEAGETRQIPKALFNAALVAGLVPEDPLEPAPEPVKNMTVEERVTGGLLEACKTLIAKGVPNDFTMAGLPRAASLKKLVDFDFTNKDAKLAFEQAMHEIEQDGNDST